MQARLDEAHATLRQRQAVTRQADQEEPPLFVSGDLVWLQNKRRRKGENPKLMPKFVGPYQVLEAYPNHSYRIERQGQSSTQNEARLKLYHPCTSGPGQAPSTSEIVRRPNMKGAVNRQKSAKKTDDTGLDDPPIIETAEEKPSRTRQPDSRH